MKRAILHILVSGFIGNSCAIITISEASYTFLPDALHVCTLNPSSIIPEIETNKKTTKIELCSVPDKKEHENSEAIIFYNQPTIFEETSARKQLRKKDPFKPGKGSTIYPPIYLQPKFIRLKIPP